MKPWLWCLLICGGGGAAACRLPSAFPAARGWPHFPPWRARPAPEEDGDGRCRGRGGGWGARGRHGGMLRPAVRQPLRLRSDAEGGRGALGRAQRPRAAAAAALPGAHGPLRPRRPEPELGAGQEAHPAAPVRRGGRQLHRGLAVRGLPRPGAGRQQRAAAAVRRRRAFSVGKAAAGLFGLFCLLQLSECRADPAVPVQVPW